MGILDTDSSEEICLTIFARAIPWSHLQRYIGLSPVPALEV